MHPCREGRPARGHGRDKALGFSTNSGPPCVTAGVEVNRPTHFTLYTKGAGKARPEVRFSAAGKGSAVRDLEIIDNHNYSYTVRYTAVQQVRCSGRGAPGARPSPC